MGPRPRSTGSPTTPLPALGAGLRRKGQAGAPQKDLRGAWDEEVPFIRLNIGSWSSDSHAGSSPTPSPGGGRLMLNPSQPVASSSPPPGLAPQPWVGPLCLLGSWVEGLRWLLLPH